MLRGLHGCGKIEEKSHGVFGVMTVDRQATAVKHTSHRYWLMFRSEKKSVAHKTCHDDRTSACRVDRTQNDQLQGSSTQKKVAKSKNAYTCSLTNLLNANH
jgi:hypothetical protein